MLEAQVNIFLYSVDETELSRLVPLEPEVFELLLKARITNRAIWQGEISGDTRMVRLCVYGLREPCVFEIPSHELLAQPNEATLKQIAIALSNVF